MDQFPGYTRIRRLPAGGMNDVHVARDSAKHTVVIRCLREPLARKRKWRNSFIQGAEILQQLDHPNIVKVLEVHKQSPYYMVVEYVESRTLRSLILSKDPMVRGNLLFLLRQMASALYYLHATGYLHLDFKPDNLLVRPDARIVLIDFDLVTPRRKTPTKVKEIDGTPFYMPPEAQRSRRVDEKADIYAFGVTAYEMINLHKPFQGDTLDNARRAQANPKAKPIPFHRSEQHIPPALQGLIFKCLAKDPRDRYPAMSLVLKNLENLV